MVHTLITFGVAIILTVATLLIFNKKVLKTPQEKFKIFLKVVVVLFCAIGLFRLMLSDSFIYVINGEFFEGKYYEKTDILQSILRWGHYISYAVLPIAVFFKVRFWRNVAVYFTLPFAILTAIFYGDFMKYFLAPGLALQFSETFRHIVFIIEISLAIFIPLMIAIKLKHRFNVKDKKEWLVFLIALPLVLLQMVPIYIPQSLFGYTKYSATSFSRVNLLWNLFSVIQVIVFYYVFRFKKYEVRYTLILFLAIMLFYSYNSIWIVGFSNLTYPSSIASINDFFVFVFLIMQQSLPMHLCNLGAYMVLIAIVSRNEKVFNFAFLANIVGTLIAMLIPDMSGGIFKFNNVHFMVEHMMVFIVLATAMALRLFPRITQKSLKHYFVGFTIYFSIVLTIGVTLNANHTLTGFKPNYFYLTDFKTMSDYIPFLSFLKAIKWQIKDFTFYPLLPVFIYVGFTILVLGFYALVQKIYRHFDDSFKLRQSRIDLKEKITKKKSNSPKIYED